MMPLGMSPLYAIYTQLSSDAIKLALWIYSGKSLHNSPPHFNEYIYVCMIPSMCTYIPVSDIISRRLILTVHRLKIFIPIWNTKSLGFCECALCRERSNRRYFLQMVTVWSCLKFQVCRYYHNNAHFFCSFSLSLYFSSN